MTTLAKQITLPEDVLDGLASHPNKDVRTSALANSAAPTATLRRELPSVTDEKSLERILRGTNNKRSINLNMPPELLERFSQHSNRTIRFLVARYPNANFTMLERLAFDDSDLVRQTVAENLGTPCDLLVRMAEREKLTTSVGCYHTVSSQICRRQDAPPEALDAIARQPIQSIRRMAVANANLASETLAWIAQNETDEAVLKGVAIHPNVEESVLAALVERGSVAVREAITALPNCPPQILLLELLTQIPSTEVCLKIAANPSTPATNLDLFIASEKAVLRAAVASNPSLSITQLEQLAADDKIEVRRAVANNPNAPEGLRRSLQALLIRAEGAEAKPISPTLRDLPRLFDPEKEALPVLLADYFESENDFVRLVVLLNPQTPVEVLESGKRSQSWLERYAVAENSATPIELRRQLTQDDHALVAAVAQSMIT
ncbi:MAG: hypothetical protein WBB01_24815 [Phormidesmis sp.]